MEKQTFTLRQKYEIGGVIKTKRAIEYSKIFDVIELLFTSEQKEIVLSGIIKITLKDIRQMYVDAVQLRDGGEKFFNYNFNECYTNRRLSKYDINTIFINDYFDALQDGFIKNYTEYRKQNIINANKKPTQYLQSNK